MRLTFNKELLRFTINSLNSRICIQLIEVPNIMNSSKKDQGLILGDYVIDNMKPFAGGAFGSIYLCRKKTSSGYNYVAKKIDNKFDDIITYERNIITALESVKSKYVLKYKKTIEKNEATYFISRFCNAGDLEKYLGDIVFFTVWELQDVLSNMIEALAAIHKWHRSMIHRDIKSANFFLHRSKKDKKLRAFLADFGFAKSSKGMREGSHETILGTPVTMAPELWSNDPYGFPADMWSFGVVLYELCFGCYPFEKDPQAKIKIGTYIIPKFSTISGECVKLIEHCLQKDPRKRPESKNIFAIYPKLKEDIKTHNMYRVTKNIELNVSGTEFKNLLESFEKKGSANLPKGSANLPLELIQDGSEAPESR